MASDPPNAPSAEETLALFRRGLELHRQGQLEQAESIYGEVLRRYPGNPDASHLLGLLRHHTGRSADAVELISTAIAGNPHVAAMYANRGLALAALARLDEAVADHDRAILLNPGLAQSHYARAKALRDLGRLDEALAGYDQALALGLGQADIHIDRGHALKGLGRTEAALASFDRALALQPASAGAHFNRANALKALGRLDEAIAAYDQAIALQPQLAIAHHNRAVSLLLDGRLDEGFQAYEWRKACPDFDDPRYGLRDPWLGEANLAGRTLFIYPELYLGDAIQFSRYVRHAEARGARVVLAAPRPLHALLSTLSPTLTLLPADATPTDFDLQCALMSLPLAFGTQPETAPAEVPYLAAQPARIDRWSRRIGEAGFRIGICWQGSTQTYAQQMQRSFPLRALEGIARQPGVRLISLQKHDGLDQLDALPPGMAVETLGDDFDAGPDAFVDTAAAMVACDLVISADTATAHVAGALGARTWLALPSAPDWRWMLRRDDCPWYPSMRLFRQPAAGDWAGVFAQMEAALGDELRAATEG